MADSEELQPSRMDKFVRRNRWWYAAAVVVALVVAGLVYVLLPSGGSTSAPPARAGTAPGAQRPAPAAGWADPGCAGSSGSSAVPTEAPQVSWVANGPMSVPASPEFGPTRTNGPVRSCFQHSPTGALVAAAVITESPSPQALMAGMTPGPGRDQTVAGERENAGAPNPLTPAGFRFRACQPDRCQLDLLLSTGGLYGQVSLSMVWSGGDWKVDGSGGPLQPSATQTMPSGYVPWGPTS